MTSVSVLGIRHHGPGSARSVRHALERLRPGHVVIEGPPELDALVPLAGDPGLVPPVAGLVYDVEDPRHASFYPMAVFSPEWVALRWALENGAAVQFADLPAANRLAMDRAEGDEPDDAGDDAGGMRDAQPPDRPDVRIDPIGALAEAAGYDDPERWWEDAVEQRAVGDDALARFAAVRDAMAEFRAGFDDDDLDTRRLLEREAAMRKVIRKVVAGATEPVAVVCGAFHAPVLHPDDWPTATADNTRLRGLPKTKVAATWAPWTSGRLAHRSGYGAGVDAPRWYEHLFTVDEDVVAHWMVGAARMLRSHGHDASAAAAVEATRLAETLAALRGRPVAGLAEVTDAAVTVLGNGSEPTMRSIHDELLVGHALGTVPADTPLVPLARDLAAHQRSLRLKVSAEQKVVTLDLRQASQLARSVLFRRLHLLGIPWAIETSAGRTGGTFKEVWTLEWQPELTIAVIEASLFGTTIESAATAKAVDRATSADSLQQLATLVERCLVADLPAALAEVLTVMAERTALAPDQQALMAAVEPLARSVRYGDVRGTDTTAVAAVMDTVVTRVAIGLATACASLNDEAAAEMRPAIEAVDRGVGLVRDARLLGLWRDALAALPAGVHGGVAGSVTRILLDCGRLTIDEATRRLGRALSLVHAPGDTAAWLDGFLAGDVALLLHDPHVFGLIDAWLCDLDEQTFEDLLPLVRRTFSHFQPGERRQIGDLVGRGPNAVRATDDDDIDLDRAGPAMAKVADLLGLGGPRDGDR